MGEDWSMSKTLDRLQTEGKANKIEALQELLNSCTEEERAAFSRFYGLVEMVPEKRLDSAIKLVERTIRKNGRQVDIAFYL
jgi:hypothetical protein